ncbi:MAG: serine/threonine protein kinase [Chloroflexota bacterium]|nr:serine/threonine protein kinase [Chloroflexota bacterium]
MTTSPPPPLLHQRYRILARLGQSRLAIVYRAHDERLQRPVLVHFLREELVGQDTLRQRFLEEAQRGAQRSHHGLLEVYDSGDISGRPYMITEDITGQPLADHVPLPVAESLSVLRTVASAVALAQGQGSPHPPVSSRNVWLIPGGRTVLLENWLLSPQDAALDLAHYRAPERARGAPPSPATTVYALGILSWETLVGQRPFTAPTPEAIAERQLREPLRPLSEVRPQLFVPGLDRVIQGATASDPGQRYPAPVDFGRALDLYVDQTTAQTGRLAILPQPQPAPAPRPRAIFRRRGDTAVAPAIRPPPPAPVLRDPPPVARRVVPAPAPSPVPAAPMEQPATQKAMERAARRQQRRRSCQRALVKRSIQVALIIAVIYGALVGIDYATGRMAQLDPAGWITGRLPQIPDLSWLGRLIDWRGIAGNATPSTLVVTREVNLRRGPSTKDEVISRLDEGTVLQRLEGPVDDPDGAFQWIRVRVMSDGTEGWVADQAGRLRPQ